MGSPQSCMSLPIQLYQVLCSPHGRYLLPYMKLHWNWSVVLSWGMIFALGLSAFGIFQVDSRAQGSTSEQFEEAALRAVTEKYFAAYGKKDLAGVVALWSEKSPH